ncbi:MAG: helix-hairpin-helix domain-containing protein [Bacillota bacterium]
MLTFDRRTQYLLLVVVAALLFGAGIKYGRLQSARDEPPGVSLQQVNDDQAGEKEPSLPETISVHVAGEVEAPGVYKLPKGSRVEDAINAARVKASAEPDLLNRAALLTDGQKVVVPPRGTGSPGEAVFNPEMLSLDGGATAQGGRVNINLATTGELDQKLPGIGSVLAQRIVDYRQQNGPFRTIEEITDVSGIGEAKFNQIKDLITVH